MPNLNDTGWLVVVDLPFDSYDYRHDGVEDAYSFAIDSERVSHVSVFGMASANAKVSVGIDARYDGLNQDHWLVGPTLIGR